MSRATETQENMHRIYVVGDEDYVGTTHTGPGEAPLAPPGEATEDAGFVVSGEMSSYLDVYKMRCPSCKHHFKDYCSDMCLCNCVMCHCGNIWDGNAQCLCFLDD